MLISVVFRCTHCKALAPIWETLAEELKGQVAVYEVDCEGSASGACKLEKVKSYPTLFLFESFFSLSFHENKLMKTKSDGVFFFSYNDGVKVEYKQKRSIEAMKGFAVKAASALVFLLSFSPYTSFFLSTNRAPLTEHR